MRCAVDGCRPVVSESAFSDTGSWWLASTSSSENMRSSTWIAGVCASLDFMSALWGKLAVFCIVKEGFSRWQALGALLLAWAVAGQAAEPPKEARWGRLPKLQGRITAQELGLVINT